MDTRVGPTLAITLLLVLAGCLSSVSVSEETSTPMATPSATPTPDAHPSTTDGTLTVHYLNIGQGNSVLVVGPTGETMLVDSGHWEDDGEFVIAYLERLGIDRIDYLVSSHADADHIGGHAEVIEHFETQGEGVGAVYDPGIASSSKTYEAYLDAVEKYEIPLYKTLDGDSIPLSGADVDVLSPPEGYLAGDDRNENSLVLRVAFGDVSFLLTGDAEHDAEQYMIDEEGAGLSATVLQVGHHGSSSPAFLDRVTPQVAVISSAYDSQYGHPHEEVLDRLAARSVRTYWTAVHGTVAVRTDGQSLTVLTQREATTDPRSLYSAPAVAPGATDPLEPRVELSGDQVETVAGTPSGETPVATDGGANRLAIAEYHGDAAGEDRENLNDEYVVFENTGEESLDLSGWTVADGADHVYRFPDGTTLAPGERLTLHTGSGTDGGGDLYWGQSGPIWNNDDETIVVHDANGRLVLEERRP